MHIFLGGSFDPVHIGHLRIATELAELFAHEVHLMPCKSPVHKLRAQGSSEARVQMLKLATAGIDLLKIDARELEAKSESYTIHSLRSMHQQGLKNIVMAIGTDSATSMKDWKCAAEFASLCNLVVLKRPNYDDEQVTLELDRMGFAVVGSPEELQNQRAGRALLYPVSQLQISSSDIRKRVEQKMSIRYLVPDAVERFICDNGLYRS